MSNAWMGATHVQMRTLPPPQMALNVLAQDQNPRAD